MRLFVIAVLAALATAWVGCRDEPNTGEPTSGSAAALDMNMNLGDSVRGDFGHRELIVLEPAVTTPPSFAGALDEAVGRYLVLQSALASGDGTLAARVASEMRAAVEGADVSGLDAEAKRAWEGHRNVLRTALHQLAAAPELPRKREHFSHVTEAVYCAIKSFHGSERRLYVAYCPLALSGRGAYWLSPDRVIRNPYLGTEKPACGEWREILE